MLCCLLLPLQGLAQAQASEEPQAPPSPPQQGDSQEAPQGEIIPPSKHATRGSGSAVSRVPFGILLGTLGGGIGTIPGAIFGSSVCFNECGSVDPAASVGMALGAVGALIGCAATINLTGDWLGGQGDFWPTALGTLLGALGGVGIAVLAFSSGEVNLVAVFAVLFGPAVGGVIAYEISHARNTRAAPATSSSGPRIVPVLTASRRGGFIGGLAGSF